MAQAVNINQITLRTLSGTGTVTLASPALPAALGPLAVGASLTVPLTLNVPATVTRFSVTETGTLVDASAKTSNYSIAQTVIPQIRTYREPSKSVFSGWLACSPGPFCV